jgi:Protein of unknown function (DUF2637)
MPARPEEQHVAVAATGPSLSAEAIAHDKWLSRFRTLLVAVLGGTVTGIACLAFYTSFEAIKSYAVRSQGIAPEHAWAVPLLVDSFIVVATGADLWFTTTKQRRAWWEVVWPKLLLASAAGVSFVLNVAHAQHNWAARGVAAIPPAALVLGVELLMMVRRRATTIRAARLEAEIEAQQAASLQAPLSRIQIEAMRRPRPDEGNLPAPAARARAEASTVALPRPAAPRPAGPAPAAPRPQEPAARPAPRPSRPVRLAASVRTGNGEAESPMRIAARILDERGDAESLTFEALVEALARRGVRTDLDTAAALLRELRARPPLSSRVARRPTRAAARPS